MNTSLGEITYPPPERYPQVPRSVDKRFFDVVELLNKVSVQDTAFDEFSWKTKTPWAVVASQLWLANQPFEADPTVRAKALRHVRLTGQPFPNCEFDLPDLYEGGESHFVDPEMVLCLIAKVALCLRGLIPDPERPRQSIWLIADHFGRLGSAPLRVDFSALGHGASHPKLFLVTPGLDSMVWRTLLDFCDLHPDNWRDFVGVCKPCKKIFRKSRSDRVHCSAKCASRTSYKNWRDKGQGLDKRKEKRAKMRQE